MITMPLETGHEGTENLAEPRTRAARLLGVGGDHSLFRELARYVEQSGATLERSSDEATTLQALAHGGWDAVLTVLDRDADVQLEWWEEVLPRLPIRRSSAINYGRRCTGCSPQQLRHRSRCRL